jgi:hypothetical protein
MKTVVISVVMFAALAFGVPASPQTTTRSVSGVYLTAADYEAGRLSFVGDSGSKGHKLEIHDVLNKPYIDVMHESEKHRSSKSEVFGYRASNGFDYRFGGKFEYQILEANDLYIYLREISVSQGRTSRTVREYYFSVRANSQIQALTLENLKQAFPHNHRFHDWLDATFGAGQNLAEYDEFHKMFKVNRLLIASREQ